MLLIISVSFLLLMLLLNLVFYNMNKVIFLLSLIFLSSCDRNPFLGASTMPLPHVAPDTAVVDSQSISNHDYLIFYRSARSYRNDYHLEPFQVLHSPDCYCRYNRKFIVVKHSK